VPYGLAAWASLAQQLAVETPVMDALVALGRAAARIDPASGRGVAELGLQGLDAAAMLTYATEGVSRE
jgi:hypothetical protein